MKKKLFHYSFDSVHNPLYGGGGAWRDIKVHSALTDEYEVHLFVGHYPGAKPYTLEDIHVHILGWGGTSHLLSRLTFALFGTFHSLFSKADINVVAFSVFSPVLSFLFRPEKIILVYHHYLGKLVFKMHGIPGFLPYLMELLLLRYAKHVITSAESVARYFESRKGRKKHVKAVYNGYSTDLLMLKPEDHRYVLTFGRIDIYMKGLDLLIPAFEQASEQFSDYNLYIAGRGKGNDVKVLETMIQRSPACKRIKLILNVDEYAKRELLKNASFVCIPSRFEGWCIVSLEASACEKAVLGTEIWGLTDTVKDKQSGVLVPPDNISALNAAMVQLLSDKDYRDSLGKRGREWAKTFSWSNTAERQRDFYHEWLKETARR